MRGRQLNVSSLLVASMCEPAHNTAGTLRALDRRPFAKGPAAGTVEEKAAAFASYGAYYGTWTLDVKPGTVTHHIEDGLNPALRGRDNVRWFEFEGNDRVVLIATEDDKGGTVARKDATYKRTWERIK